MGKEGAVKDLVEKLKRGEITSKEAFKELKKRGLLEKEAWEIISWIVYFILWIPFNIKFSTQLPAIHFPLIVIYISIIFVALGIFLAVWATYIHYKRGGLKHDETIILFKEGLYGVVRHPGVLGFIMLPILLPIILSTKIPFTPLSIAAILVVTIYCFYGIHVEEMLNIEKWGDEYRRYMKEVPRFNFIKGLWNLRRRK